MHVNPSPRAAVPKTKECLHSDRIRLHNSKKKGMWMGGLVPLGYDLEDRFSAMAICAEQTLAGRISKTRT
jgi:hypothetical protein